MPVIMKEGVQYAYTEDAVKAHTLSLAEYNALTEAEKMNGDLYLIPDKQPDGTNPASRIDDLEDEVSELKSNLTNIQGMFANINMFKFIYVNGTAYNKVGSDLFNVIPNPGVTTFYCGVHVGGGQRVFFGIVYGDKSYASLFILDYNGTVSTDTYASGTWTRKSLH